MQVTSSVVPRRFEVSDQTSAQRTRALGWVALGMIGVALALVFLVAPRAQDSAGGNAQRIFYFHLSSAWVGFGAWIVAASLRRACHDSINCRMVAAVSSMLRRVTSITGQPREVQSRRAATISDFTASGSI